MPNQRAIAKAAGLTQAAVSKALRGDRSIPESTRKRIEKIAADLGYRRNAYVSTLMSHIRSGRPLRDRGCIALLVNAASQKEWLGHIGGYAYRLQYEGVLKRAEELGFTTECFFLAAANSGKVRLDGILQARGINGVIMMPGQGATLRGEISLSWDRYAMAAIAYSWGNNSIDCVSSHHRHNVEVAYREILRRGFKRVGMCLPPEAIEGVDASWRERHLLWSDRTPQDQRIPLFIGKPDMTPLTKFQKWLKTWKPDVIVCLIGHEIQWIEQLGLKTPEDIPLVCVNRPPNSDFAGVEENLEVIGSAVMDAVASRIEHNEFGLPPHPKTILIEGTWVEGKTLPATMKSKGRGERPRKGREGRAGT